MVLAGESSCSALHRAVLRVIVGSSPVEGAWLGNKLLGSWDLRFFWLPADGDQGYLTREELLREIGAVTGRGPRVRSDITGHYRALSRSLGDRAQSRVMILPTKNQLVRGLNESLSPCLFPWL